jgi:N-hydroxyarylamine O-acetyltransferase
MSDLDLKAYLRRIGYEGPVEPTLAVLEAIHLAHATHIVFESLDVLLGRPIRLDLAGIQEKLVKGGRGGYCFEQNLLLAAALRDLGFAVTQLGARVRHRGDKPLPRTHMLLMVHIDGAATIADVGFGGEGLLLPVPFRTGAEYRHYAWTYRLVEEQAGQWLLQSRREPGWGNLYSFTLEPQTLEDFEMANHYTATHPDSPFVRTLIVQLPTPAAPVWQAAAFVLFRLFDILKPPPIRHYDRTLKSGFGAMLDDLMAAFYTLIILAAARMIIE